MGSNSKCSSPYSKPLHQAPCPLVYPISSLLPACQNHSTICSSSTYLHMIRLLPGFVSFHMSAWKTLLVTLSSSIASLRAYHVGPLDQSPLHQSLITCFYTELPHWAWGSSRAGSAIFIFAPVGFSKSDDRVNCISHLASWYEEKKAKELAWKPPSD